jgi:N-ethylmaleimide reductase
LAEGVADAVAFGRLFLANPDLPQRFRLNAARNTPDESTFYGGTDKGYTDYPTLSSRQEEEVPTDDSIAVGNP